MGEARTWALIWLFAGIVFLPATAEAQQAYRSQCGSQLCGGVSEDGSRAVFPFAEELTPGAVRNQIYERVGGETRPLIQYPKDAPPPGQSFTGLDGLSSDARHVFITTDLSLSPQDHDGGLDDIYDIFRGDANLVSTGPLDTQGGYQIGSDSPSFGGVSADGNHVFLNYLTKAMVPEDTDNCPDLYERFNGQTTLLSTGPTATPTYTAPNCDDSSFAGLSSDGSHVFFYTFDHLVPEDPDNEVDIYQRVGNDLSIITSYPDRQGNCSDIPWFGDASADGRTVLFSTIVQLVPEDQDATEDVYKREPDGSFTLVSRGTDSEPGYYCGAGLPDKAVALSADGKTAIFETSSRLSPADRDSSPDLYSTDDSGAMRLVTTGPTDSNVDGHRVFLPFWPAAVSDDARSVAFETRQALVAADTDNAEDVYLWANGDTQLVSTGPTGGNADMPSTLISLSGDGKTVAFSTREQLTGQDTDHAMDLYLSRDGQVSRPGSASISTKPRKRRTVLISGESIPPVMKIARKARKATSRSIDVRLGCPKSEKSGPCHGWVSASRGSRGKILGGEAFRIRTGRRAWIPIHLSGGVVGASIFVRVSGSDRLENWAKVSRRVLLSPRR